MMLALDGAERRLLPPMIAVPMLWLAVIAQPMVWSLVSFAAHDLAQAAIPGFSPTLGAIHALTIGMILPVVLVTAMQILCVIMLRSPPPSWRLAIQMILLALGGIGVVTAAMSGSMALFTIATALTAAAVILFGLELLRLVAGSLGGNLSDTRLALGIAITALFAFGTLAAILGLDTTVGRLADRVSLAHVHAVLAAYGFMGFLAIGLGLALIPMLAIAQPPAEGKARGNIALAAGALAITVAGLLWPNQEMVAAGALTGLAAAIWHIRMMEAVLAKRMRRNLGREFQLIRFGWAALVASLVLGFAIAMDLVPASPGLRILGVLLLVGWLLSFVTGILQRILPFLASMHVMSLRGKAVSPTSLAVALPLRLHFGLHLFAVAILVAGMALGHAGLVAIAGLAGTAGGLCFAAFAVSVLLKTNAALTKPNSPQRR